jgi:two-component system sensor histidine kinase RegB
MRQSVAWSIRSWSPQTGILKPVFIYDRVHHINQEFLKRVFKAKSGMVLNPNTANLRGLCIIRSLVIFAQFAAVYYAQSQLGWQLPYVTLQLLLAAISVFAMFSWWRSFRSWPVTDIELFVHLCVDIVGFSAVLYFSGGASNPFISYLLVPLCISAATLPWAYTWLLSGLGFIAYSLLLFYFIPLEALSPHQQHGSALNTHILGMWANFLVSAILITYFVFKMAHRLRQRESELATSRETSLQDEQLLAVATLAAGTAHELGTPLSTMKVILGDLTEQQFDPDTNADIATLQQQLDHCKNTLNRLVTTARDLGEAQRLTISCEFFLAQLIDHWQVLRPDCHLHSNMQAALTQLDLELDGTVSQAILNLMNNAADVSPAEINLEILCDKKDLIFAISDRGPGLDPQQAELMSKAFVSTKGKGRGLGLFLSHATANRYGGSLRWLPRQGGGSRVELRLALNKVQAQL